METIAPRDAGSRWFDRAIDDKCTRDPRGFIQLRYGSPERPVQLHSPKLQDDVLHRRGRHLINQQVFAVEHSHRAGELRLLNALPPSPRRETGQRRASI
jgi:hypothetical protein